MATTAPAGQKLQRGQLGLAGVIMPGLAQIAPAFNLFGPGHRASGANLHVYA
ncbi:MAG TPA: hypothetical protein VK162_07995 [Streptosporangiaceae bacterium]|nr:hypothetical protein [Streptosporangiaceae bacterium]